MDSHRKEDASANSVESQQIVNPQKQNSWQPGNLFILFSFVVCFAFCELVLFGGFGIAVPLFFAVFYPFAIAMLKHRRRVFKKSALLSFLPVFILLTCFAVFDNTLLRFFNIVAIWLSVMFNLICMAAEEGDSVFWAGILFDILKATFYLPFHNIGKRAAAFTGSFKSGARRKTVIILLTLLMISPFLIIVLAMLASSDAGFEAILNRLGGIMTAQFWEYLFKIILSALLTLPLFNLLYALSEQMQPQKHPIDGLLLKLGCLNPLSTVSALYAFCVIYVFYIALQANYLFSAILGVLPASFTYAEYARRGFFELTGIVFINFCIVTLAVALTKRDNGKLSKSCRFPALLLIACTLLLVVTATSKMILYIGSYGLTPLRVYTFWFMLLLFILTLFMMLKLIMPRFNFYRFCAVGAISFYLALNLVNVDGLIAHYNISLYYSSGKLDTQVLCELSDSALPEIAVLRHDARYGDEIQKLLDSRKKQLGASRWQNLSLPQLAEK